MAKEGWLSFEDLMIAENKIVAVSKKKNKVTVYLQGGHEFSLSKAESQRFWNELNGNHESERIVLAETSADGDNLTS